MSHAIKYLSFHCSKSEHAILKEINQFAYDPEETSGYHGGLKFHKDIVCKNYDEAVETLNRRFRSASSAVPSAVRHTLCIHAWRNYTHPDADRYKDRRVLHSPQGFEGSGHKRCRAWAAHDRWYRERR